MTITTKTTGIKNSARSRKNYYLNGVRTSRENIEKTICACYRAYSNEVIQIDSKVAEIDFHKIFVRAHYMVRELNIVFVDKVESESIPDNQPANITAAETDGSEDDRDNEDAFAFLPTLDELNDINTEPVAHVTFHDTDTKFLPGGQEIQHIRINSEQILIVNGETCFITSKKYNARYDAFEKTFYLATPLYLSRSKLTTEEKFWAAMAERGACSFDTPDKTALADSLTRAMKIALENFQAFCRARNLTGAERELKLYNICRKALSELWRR